MITNFNEFKQKMNESVDVNKGKLDYAVKLEHNSKIAINCGLTRKQTIKIVETIFTDVAKAPEEINVNFVKENLNDHIKHLEMFNEKDFGFDYNFTQKELEAKNPFEIMVMVEAKNVPILINLFTSLKNNIKKDDFFTIYSTYTEGRSTLYINNINKLNENNKKIVLNTLKKADAINISTQLKWARIIA